MESELCHGIQYAVYFTIIQKDCCGSIQQLWQENIYRRGTFKYHMTLRKGICSNLPFAVIMERGRGVWPNRHILLLWLKKLKITVPLALFTVHVGGGVWLETSYWGRGWLKTSEYRMLKNRHMIFERSLVSLLNVFFTTFELKISVAITHRTLDHKVSSSILNCEALHFFLCLHMFILCMKCVLATMYVVSC